MPQVSNLSNKIIRPDSIITERYYLHAIWYCDNITLPLRMKLTEFLVLDLRNNFSPIHQIITKHLMDFNLLYQTLYIFSELPVQGSLPGSGSSHR